jgi:hypothetical protein
MNLKTPYDVLCSTFCASGTSKKDDCKDCSFHFCCGSIIRAQKKLLEKQKLEVKQQAHSLKGKVRQHYRGSGRQCSQEKKIDYINQIVKKKHGDLTSTKKGRKKKTCHYCKKLGHMEKACW